MQQCVGNSNMLVLVVGQYYVIFVDDGIQIIIYFVNEIYGVGYVCGFFNLFVVVFFGMGIGDIVGDGIVEQMYVL